MAQSQFCQVMLYGISTYCPSSHPGAATLQEWTLSSRLLGCRVSCVKLGEWLPWIGFILLTQDIDPLQRKSTLPSIGEHWRVFWVLAQLHPCSKTPNKLTILYSGIIISFPSILLPGIHQSDSSFFISPLKNSSQSLLSFVWSLESCLHWLLSAQQIFRYVLWHGKYFHQARCAKWNVSSYVAWNKASLSGGIILLTLAINLRVHQCFFYLYNYFGLFSGSQKLVAMWIFLERSGKMSVDPR